MALQTVQDIRRINLQTLVDEWGGVVNFANFTGKSDSRIRQLLGAFKNFGEASAREFEVLTHRERGWMDHPHDSHIDIEKTTALGDSPTKKINAVDNVRPAAPDTRRVPVISYVQAGNPIEAIDSYAAGGGMKDIYTNLDLGPYAFALIVKGESMEPLFEDGDIVVIDPRVAPKPGSYVVAKCNGDEATLKKYRPRGNSADGQEVFELVPLNPDYATIYSSMTPTRIIGTVVELRKNLAGLAELSPSQAANASRAYQKAVVLDGRKEAAK